MRIAHAVAAVLTISFATTALTAAFKAKHGAGCGCCSGKSSMRRTQRGKKGAKSFPGSRPWMISH